MSPAPGWIEKLDSAGSSLYPKEYTKAPEMQSVELEGPNVGNLGEVKVTSAQNEAWTPKWIKASVKAILCIR